MPVCVLEGGCDCFADRVPDPVISSFPRSPPPHFLPLVRCALPLLPRSRQSTPRHAWKSKNCYVLSNVRKNAGERYVARKEMRFAKKNNSHAPPHRSSHRNFRTFSFPRGRLSARQKQKEYSSLRAPVRFYNQYYQYYHNQCYKISIFCQILQYKRTKR